MALLALLTAFGCSGPARNVGRQDPPTDPRKEKTEAELRRLGIPINPWLPLVESEEEARVRDPKDVARRTLVLNAVVAYGHGLDRRRILDFLHEEDLWDYASPSEKQFFEAENPSEQARIDATWRAEALWTLLWALGKIEELTLPTQLCDTERILELMPQPGKIGEYINSAKLRPISDILDETDRIYRLHWAVRDAQLKNEKIPAGLNPGVVVERHYALNWLTWYAEEWDDVTTDT